MTRISYSQELGNEIVERISKGETLRAICREDGKPHWTTVYDWIAQDADFSLRIARARELGHDAIAEECLEIADTSSAMADVQRDRLRVDTRLKLLAKWNSRKYGDKVDVTTAGKPINEPSTARLSDLLRKAGFREGTAADDKLEPEA